MAKQQILPIVNIKKFYVARLLTDDSTNVTYDTPMYCEGIKELGLKPKQNTDDYFHEGRLVLTLNSFQNIDATINITDLTDKQQAYIYGHTIAKTGGVIKNQNDLAPDLAMLFQAEKANGVQVYGVVFSGNFQLPDEDYKDREGKTNFQSKKLQGSFKPLKNGLYQYVVCSDSEGVTEDFISKFFDSVQLPEKAPNTAIPNETVPTT